MLSEAAPLPFPIAGNADINEEARLKYRYLDLRREGPAAALRVRSQANRVAREVMAKHRFVEVETPNLTRSTPEGARDFLVPVRLQPGHWYALPQSPQLFKQLLMVAGMERYFQIARCFRDEDFRADRQPEFTQLDIEMSFIDQDDIIALGEDIVAALWREILAYEIPLPIARMTYADAMSRYGSDKPDLRFGNELVDCTAFFECHAVPGFPGDLRRCGRHAGRRVADPQRTRWLDRLGEVARRQGPGLRARRRRTASWAARSQRTCRTPNSPASPSTSTAAPGDAIFFAAGERTASLELLGAARLEIGRRCELIDESLWKFLWVVDAPMFEPTADGGWTAVHHPFTSPKPEYADTFQDVPGEALAYAYDIVVNGSEIGGGSIRIHRGEMQQRVFDVIGLTKDEAESKFGFLLEAFTFGPPPHGGIALGWDRVLTMLTGTESIREVIAFPKTASGGDPLTGAPTPITAQQRKEAGIDAIVTRSTSTP